MSAKQLLDHAAVLRREARAAWFLASGPSAFYDALNAAAVALERAAGEQARRDNQTNYKRRSA